MKPRIVTVGVAVSGLLLTACGAQSEPAANPGDVATEGTKGQVVALPEGGDFPQAESPAEAARVAKAVFTGTIEGYEDGRTEVTTNDDGTEEHDRYVVIRVKVDEVLKGTDLGLDSGYAYLTRPRGVEMLDARGKMVGEGGTVAETEVFEEALPVGTKVLVMAPREEIAQLESVEVVEPGKGAPKGATLLNVYNPNTLVAEGVETNPVTGWQEYPGGYSGVLDEIQDALRASKK